MPRTTPAATPAAASALERAKADHTRITREMRECAERLRALKTVARRLERTCLEHGYEVEGDSPSADALVDWADDCAALSHMSTIEDLLEILE